MMAMDQVLKANEINFAFMAFIPAAVLFSFGLLSIKRYVFKEKSRKELHRRMRAQIRRVEALLISNYDQNGLDDKNTGLLLLYLQKLTDLVKHVPLKERQTLAQDIKQLASLDFNIKQKQLIIERMFRSYSWKDSLALE
jgi:nuclear-control-of-ATPase protein 2